jgi:hypothetical protein
MKWDRGLPYQQMVGFELKRQWLPFVVDVYWAKRMFGWRYRKLASRVSCIPDRLVYGVRADGVYVVVYWFWCLWIAGLRLRRKIVSTILVFAWRLDLARPEECYDGMQWCWQKEYRKAEKWSSRGCDVWRFLKDTWARSGW